jgi:hypothetical protein
MNKLVLLFSILGTVLVWLTRNSVEFGFCLNTDKGCRIIFDRLENILYIFPIILLFSLVTYFLREQAFKSWFKFLVTWGVLTLLVATLVHTEIIFPNPDEYIRGFSNILMLTMYGVFFAGSIISIVRGYNSDRKLG